MKHFNTTIERKKMTLLDSVKKRLELFGFRTSNLQQNKLSTFNQIENQMNKKTFEWRRMVTGALTAGFLLFSGVGFAADPCSVTPSVGGGQKIDFSGGNQRTGNTQGGYSYELWRNGGGSGSITLYNQEAAFKAEWNNAGDYLGRVGKSWGNTPSVDNIGGNLVVEYQFQKSGNDGGTYSYVGIYGWMNNPQIEYYIVDDWLHDRGTPGGSYIGSKKGTITVDGEEYAVWTGTRTGESKWGTSTFTQIFSIRQSRRQCGTIHVSEHFRQWKKLGLNLGGLMECQILAEAGGG